MTTKINLHAGLNTDVKNIRVIIYPNDKPDQQQIQLLTISFIDKTEPKNDLGKTIKTKKQEE